MTTATKLTKAQIRKAEKARMKDMQRAVRMGDDRDFDSKGRVVYLQREPKETEVMEYDVEEPFDPAYLEDEVDYTVSLEKGEVGYIRKVGKLQDALRKAQIPYDWNGEEFIIEKIVDDLRYERRVFVDEDDLDYCYGTYEIDMLCTRKLSEMLKQVKYFMSDKN